MSYRSLGSDEVTLRNYRPVGRRKGNMSLSDPLAAGVVVDLHKPGLSGIRIRVGTATWRRSITSSAMASSVGGTSMPSALAVAAVSSLHLETFPDAGKNVCDRLTRLKTAVLLMHLWHLQGRHSTYS